MTQTFFLLSLGCAKNTVDSDGMAQLLIRAGWEGVAQPDEADLMIVNTCGFLEAARIEATDALEELAAIKRPDQLLIAAGCMPQIAADRIIEEVPAVDGVIGTRRWMDIVDFIASIRDDAAAQHHYHVPESAQTVGEDERGVIRASLTGTSAYLKIADGCMRGCAFCTIPAIKGTLVSRPMDRILEEARVLQDEGVREIILIAQASTDYGHDLGMEDGLAALLEALIDAVPDVPWLRVLYTYPAGISERLIDLMANAPQVLPYIDLPLQHADPDVLRRMGRPADMDAVRRFLDGLRERIPDVALRTAFIVGHPGETPEAFDNLIDFVRAVQFDMVGAFIYSAEVGTRSAKQPGTVPEVVARSRYHKLMAEQQAISLARNKAWVGRSLDVLLEGFDEEADIVTGRSFRSAPEIDGLVAIEEASQPLTIGEIVEVQVVGALPYDLLAKV